MDLAGQVVLHGEVRARPDEVDGLDSPVTLLL